jgi:short-subunit dehydrogenase
VSSLSGRISTPMTGAYNASKFALEGLADALRIELRAWQIPVSLVEPGPVATDLWHHALDSIEATAEAMTPEQRELYAGHIRGARRTAKVMLKLAVDPDRVAAAVEQALTARRPRARYLINPGSRAQLVLTALTPTRLRDAVLARAMGS